MHQVLDVSILAHLDFTLVEFGIVIVTDLHIPNVFKDPALREGAEQAVSADAY